MTAKEADFHHKRRSSDSRGEPQVHFHRRATDPENAVVRLHSRVDDCESSIRNLTVGQTALSHEIKAVGENIQSIAEILIAWNSARGFLSTMRFIAGFIKVVMIIGAFLGLIWIFLKTGVWPGQEG